MAMALTIPAPQELAGWGDRKLDNAIRRGYTLAGAHRNSYEEAATTTGVLLVERKQRLGRGEWLPWVRENFEGSEATAKRYMEMGREWLRNRSSVSDLNPSAESSELAEPEWLNRDDRPYAFSDEDIERDAAEARRRREEMKQAQEPKRSRTPATVLDSQSAYALTVAALDALARARGAVREEGRTSAAGRLDDAHKLVRGAIMALHTEGVSNA